MTFGAIWRSVMTVPDKILLLSLLALSLSSYALISHFFAVHEARTAVVEIAGREEGRFSLDPLLPPRKIPLRIDGGEAIFEVSGGSVRLLPLPDRLCKHHICSRKGWVSAPWEMIVCLPNRIVLRILGNDYSKGLDLVTH